MYKLSVCFSITAIFILLFAAAFCAAQSPHKPNSIPSNSVKNFLQNSRYGEDKDARYFYSFVDLRDDGKREVIVYLMSPSGWCGSGGCPTLILSPRDASYKVITQVTITRLPIRVLVSKSNGWHDLSLWVGGGGLHHHEVKLRFDGSTYPSNPSMPPAEPLTEKVSGKIVIPEAIITKGIPLYP